MHHCGVVAIYSNGLFTEAGYTGRIVTERVMPDGLGNLLNDVQRHHRMNFPSSVAGKMASPV
jgi:hypothetical protein